MARQVCLLARQVCLLAMLVLHEVAAQSSEFQLVETPVGKVRGLKLTAENGKPLWSFRGIPYALPPVGQLRFTKPLPYPRQNDIIDATKPGYSCIQAQQLLLPEEKTSEDCLVLNIFVKDINVKPQAPKKVLVYIHGGGFFMGSSFGYNPGTIVVDHDIIVVTIQYRLGVLGFLTTKNEASLGNFGLWDQVLALRWVKSNIEAFGGDPRDITIAGESAGGASVSLLTLSPVTKGLFSKAYSASGVATSLFTQYRNSETIVISLARSLNCWDRDATTIGASSGFEIIQCLRSRPASDFSSIQFFEGSRPIYVPWADGEFFTDSPPALINDRQYLEDIGFYDRRYLFSLNNNEQSVVAPFLFMTRDFIYSNSSVSDEDKLNSWQHFLFHTCKTTIGDRLGVDDVPEDLVRNVLEWYQARKSSPNDVIQLISDLSFIIPTLDILNAIEFSRRTESWLLYFNHYPRYISGDIKGMMHALDLSYWFDVEMDVVRRLLTPYATGDFGVEDIALKKLFISIVASFVKNGNPGIPLLDQLSKGWPPYNKQTANYLDFHPVPFVQGNFERVVSNFWEKEVPTMVLNQDEGQHTEL